MPRPDPTDHREQIRHHATALRNIIGLIPGGGDVAHMRGDAAVAEEQALAALAQSIETERT